MIKTRKLAKKIVIITILLIIILLSFKTNVEAVTGTYLGSVTWNGSIVGKFLYEGNIAFCIDHGKTTPNNTIESTETITSDDNLIKCLYYGWGGKAQWSGFTSEAQGIVQTSLALDHYRNGNTNRNAQSFINYIESMSLPQYKLSFSNSNLTAHLDGNKQVTNSTIIQGDSGISMTLTLQDGVTIVCENNSWSQTGGNVNVSAGDIIHFEAPLSITGNWVSADITNRNYKFQTILLKSKSEDYQSRVVQNLEPVPEPEDTINFSINWLSVGNLAIIKTDSNTGAAVPNTTFEIYNSSGTKVGTITTDAEGKGNLNDLTVGTYTIKETSSNSNYQASSETYTVTINAGQTTTKEIGNTRKTSSIVVKKVDSRDNSVLVSGATFEIYSSEDNYVTKLQTKTTGSDGTATFSNLRVGYTYKIKEIATNNNYVFAANEKTVTLSNETTQTVTISNTIKKAKIQVTKQDKDYSNIKLANVFFEIYQDNNENGVKDASDTLLQTITTNENGVATSSDLAIDKQYVVVEKKTDDNYILNTTPQTVTFTYSDAGTTKSLIFANTRKTGSIKITKVDARDNASPVSGARFEVYSLETGNTSLYNKKVTEGTTGYDGTVTFESLRVGAYRIKEVATNEWYYLDNSEAILNVKYNETETVTITNRIKLAYIDITKMDIDYTDIKLEGVKFQILDGNKVVDTLITNSNGYAKSIALPIDRVYTVKEVETLDNYLLQSNTQTVTFVPSNESKTTSLNFYNKHKEGNLHINKFDLDNNRVALGHVEFIVWSNEFNSYLKWNDAKNIFIPVSEANATIYRTDWNGNLDINTLRTGTYVLKEVTTNYWYNLAPDTNVTINWNETTISNISNELKKGQVRITKVDLDNNDIRLEGVTFKVFDKDGNELETIITNSNGQATTSRWSLRDIEKITVREVETLDNYELNDEAVTVNLINNEIAEFKFENEKKKGTIKIEKVDQDKHYVKLVNVKFEVYNSSGILVDTMVTDIDGLALSKRLPIDDTYIIKEVETDVGYKLNLEDIMTTLEWNEETYFMVENESKKGIIRITKEDSELSDIKIPNVTFEIYNSRGELEDIIITDENGIATSKELKLDDTYTVKEVEAGANYRLNINDLIVDLSYGIDLSTFDRVITKDFTITNDIQRGKIKIIKQDSEIEDIKIQGVIFEITNEKGDIVDTIITNEEGIAITSDLRVDSKYFVKEISTDKYYLLNDTIFEASVIENEETLLQITNDIKRAKIRIIKTDSEIENLYIPNVEFDIFDNRGNLIEHIITNEIGIAESSNLRLDKIYLVKETKEGKFYKLNEEEFLISLLDDIDLETYTEGFIKDFEITNDIEKGKIRIVKVDSEISDKLISGVVFEIYNNLDELMEIVITDENGIATSKDLRLDHTYYFKEVETDKFYLLNENIYNVTLEADSEVEFIIENLPKKAQIKVIKKDLLDNTILIPDVTFEIRDFKTNEVLDIITTDENGEAISRLLRLDGYFILVETKTNIKYVFDSIDLEFNLEEFAEDFKENLIKNIVIENKPILGEIEVTKQDKYTNEFLSNAEISIYKDTNDNEEFDDEDELIIVLITDENGENNAMDLRYGTYFVFESKAPKGYNLDEQFSVIKIEKDKQAEIVRFKDRIITNDIQITKAAKNTSLKTGIKETEGVPNTYFAIYAIDEDGKIINFAKDKYENYIGEKIVVENNEYYTIVTDKDGKVNIELPFGKYLAKEIKPHDFFLNDSEDLILEVLNDGNTSTLEFKDTAVNLALDISKTGIKQTQKNDEIRYDFPSIINSSNVSLDNFTWEDHLPSKYTKITKLFTGIWNEDVTLHIFYKTNKADYKEYGEGYSSLANNYIDFGSLNLNSESDEYITDFKIVFGTVKEGFTYTSAPFIFVKVNNDISNDERFINNTKLSGEYTDLNGNITYIFDEDSFETSAYEKTLELSEILNKSDNILNITKLPRTGNDLDKTSLVIKEFVITLIVLGIITSIHAIRCSYLKKTKREEK